MKLNDYKKGADCPAKKPAAKRKSLNPRRRPLNFRKYNLRALLARKLNTFGELLRGDFAHGLGIFDIYIQ